MDRCRRGAGSRPLVLAALAGQSGGWLTPEEGEPSLTDPRGGIDLPAFGKRPRRGTQPRTEACHAKE